MSENKFIRHLQGKDTAKSVLEIRNQNTPTSFANMPGGTSNANDVYSDRRGDAAGVLKGTENWKLNNSILIETSTIYGDGRDFIDDFEIGGSGLWVNATCTFTTARRFAPNTKFVLKLCGHDLDTVAKQTVGFTLIVKFGSTVITKVFSVPVQAFDFCKEFEIDFGESNSSAIKVAANSTMQVQLLCADANAQATIYNGMTVFTALQRRVDSETVSSDTLSLDEIETDLTTHIANKNNPHEVTKAQVGLGNCDNTSDLDKPISTATQTALDGKVSTDGSSIMTGPLKMRASSSFQCAIAPFWDGVGFFKLNSDNSVTLIASIDTPDGFLPWVTNTYNIGSSLKKWKNLYLAGTAYITKINNGYDLLVPAKSGTLATKEEVDLAANSGRMILDQGVWYAKMYAATVAPAAEDGTNYADFSQVDGQGNPIIVTYNRVNGAWVQDQTITPPTDYDGYVAVTAKIWDIVEQTGQNGGRILWNHQSKEFTPYPNIVSFEDIKVTGNSTVEMPLNPVPQQIVNKDYVDSVTTAFLAGKANVDMDNLTSTGKNIANWSSNVSNCITNIPQDIKLELSSGTLTLKAGSKVYVPNGASVFDTFIVETDLSRSTWGSGSTDLMVAFDTVNSTWGGFDIPNCYSGPTAPTGATNMLWYDTTNNKVKQTSNSGSTWNDGWTLPIFIVSRSSGAITSIQQVFNGFGYIGSTVFVLPGVKGLIPNGKNADGTYITTVKTISSVITRTFTTTNMFDYSLAILDDNSIDREVYYKLNDNGYLQGSDGNIYSGFEICRLKYANTSGKILNMQQFHSMRFVDYNEFSEHKVIAFMPPSADNNYSWYRLYNDGWVEQGGYAEAGTTGTATIYLSIKMANNRYFAVVSNASSSVGDNANMANVSVFGRTQTSFEYRRTANNSMYWEARGLAE